ncbi:MAG: ABC transporter permease [Fimbriimonadaceae bacterium]|nr:ABC transporter permease [Fimbriimonadaceae bacterium]
MADGSVVSGSADTSGSRLIDSPPWSWIYDALTFIGEIAILFWQTLSRLLTKPFESKELFNQMSFIGVASVPIIALTTFSSGAVIALYTSQILVKYGASSLAGGTIALSVTREIAPVLAGIMVAARCGSAMAAQIGTMTVTEQIDALRALRVPPVNYLVIPRVIAAVTMLPILAVVGMYSGIFGGYLVAVPLSGIPSGAFFRSLEQFMTMHDVWAGMLKTAVFGLIVALVACQQGLRTSGGAVGVGHATTRTVVITMVLIYVANYFLTAALFT